MKINTAAKGLAATAVLSGLLFGATAREVASSGKSERQTKPVPRVVSVAAVARMDHAPTVRLSAVTRSSSRSRVAFAIGGRIQRRFVEVGDHVEKGDPLARIDPAPFRHAVAAGRAAFSEVDARLAQAARDSARMSALAHEGAVPDATEESVDASKNALAAARDAADAQLKEATRQLRESVLRAPFTGVVTAVLADPGEMVAPGTPIAVLDGATDVEVEVEVPESLVAQVTKGQMVDVTLPMIGLEALRGTVSQVGKSALGPGGLFPVVIALAPHKQVKSGMTAEVLLPTGTVSGLWVPVPAIINPSGDAASVLEVQKGRVSRVPVSTHRLANGMVEISGNLEEGDIVVTAGHQQLLGGETVEVLR